MEESIGVTFTLPQLWVLQEAVRHGIASEESWKKYPPASLDLNDAIADAIVSCEETGAGEWTLLLVRGDLLVIDHNVSQKVKDADGNIAGKAILLKTFKARRALNPDPFTTAQREQEPTQEQWESLRALTKPKENPSA